VLALKADWTGGDKVITEWLQKFGRTGVPLYVLYLPGQVEPHVFPDALTEEMVLTELKK
jgi:thiol:disulfide interchange protein DsbD